MEHTAGLFELLRVICLNAVLIIFGLIIVWQHRERLRMPKDRVIAFFIAMGFILVLVQILEFLIKLVVFVLHLVSNS